MKMNLIWIIGSLIFVTLSSSFGILKLIDSMKWSNVDAQIIQSRYEQISRSAQATKDIGDHQIEYRVYLKYKYTVKNIEYNGSRYFVGIDNNIFDKEIEAKEIIDKYKIGTTSKVYYNPNNPSDSGFITGNDISIKGIIILSIFLLIAVSIIGGAIYALNKF